MKNKPFFRVLPVFILALLSCFSTKTSAQIDPAKSDFWQKVQFGGGIGASIGSGYTDVTIAPGAIYNFNRYVAAGLGIQGSYVRAKYDYEAYIYGGSLIG